MSRTVFRVVLTTAALSLTLGGCGLTQRVVDGGSALAQGVFHPTIKVLHLDFHAREALNTDVTEMSGLSTSTVVRVYQLKDRKALDKSGYLGLLTDSHNTLAADLVDENWTLVKPGGGVQLNVPLAQEAKYVAVVALFRSPDMQKDNWRLVLARNELDPDYPRVIELADNQLSLLSVPEKDSWW